MAKVTGIGSYQNVPSAVPKPEFGVPPVPPSGNDLLDNQLAARQNAEALIPVNMQSTGSASYSPVEDESMIDQEEVELSKYNPQPYPDVESGAEQDVLTPEGELTSYDMIVQQREQEIAAQQQTAMTFQNIAKMNNETEIREAFPASVMPTQVGTIFRATREIASSLNNIDVTTSDGNTTNALDFVSNGLGVTTQATSNLATVANILMLPMLTGASRGINADIDIDQDIQDSFDALDSILGNSEDSVDLKPGPNNSMNKDVIAKGLGKVMIALSRNANAVDENGRPIDPETQPRITRSAEEIGNLALDAAINDGIFMESTGADGKPSIIVGPIFGAPLYHNSRHMGRELTNKLSGKAQKFPVTNKGDYIGAQRNIRGGDLKKVNYTETPEMNEAKRIGGSIGKAISPQKAFFGAQLANLAKLQYIYRGQPINGLDVLSIFKINSSEVAPLPEVNILEETDPAVLENLKKREEDFKTVEFKMNNITSELTDFGGFIVDKSLNYTPYKVDYASQRLYEDPLNFNEQRNKLTRGAMTFAAPAFQMTGDYHLNGISRMTADKLIERIGNKARGRDFELSPQERELSFLITVGRVLDIGKNVASKTENMLLNEMATLVTPQFIQRAGEIGRQLRSIVPNNDKEIVNTIFAIAKDNDRVFNSSKKKIPSNVDIDSLPSFQNLIPAQLDAVREWLGNSDRETWGYTLQAYLDMANYLDAKKGNNLFNPKVTVALDMNSAGRGNIAADIGNEEILSRIGLIWEYYTDREFQDVVPGEKGDPRAYFTDVANKQGLEIAFSEDSSDKKQLWRNILEKYGGKGVKGAISFNKNFGKKVLMTGDYGKPMQYHLEEAKDFLAAYPNIQEALMNHYNNDFKKVVMDLNNIFKHTLIVSTEVWQYALPKQMVKMLQMFDKLPHPEGYFGEKMSLGNFTAQETGESIEIKNKITGKSRRLALTKAMFDPTAAAKNKHTKDLDGNEIAPPGPGTAAINQIGPLMGQYRESIIVAETMNYINGGKDAAKMRNLAPVFDNFIVDSNSYLFVHYVANNIITPKVLEWNMPKSFYSDWVNKMKEMNDLLGKKEEVLVGKGTEYRGFVITLDREYSYLQGENLTKKQEEFKKFLESGSSGYLLPLEGRPEVFKVTSKQFKNSLAKLNQYYGLHGNTGEHKFYKWLVEGSIRRQKALAKIKALAAKGQIYFFT
jgi:hypothetical protein